MPDRPVPGQVEQRTAPEAAAPTVEGRKLRGLIPYSTESRDMGGWTETMDPGCLRDASMADCVVTVDHAGVPLGRFPSTLSVEHADDGMRWSVELPESRSDVREAVERGDLKSTSWRMVVAPGGDEWRGNTRHVQKVAELRDVAIVTAPAYDDATAEYRSEHVGGTANTPEPVNPPVDTPSQEATVPKETPQEGGGLKVEDRAATDQPNVESRILDAIRGVPQGEIRSLTLSNAAEVTPQEQSRSVWDKLRDLSVVLQSGVRVISTTRKSIKVPMLVEDVTAEWTPELQTIADSEPQFDEWEVTPKKLAARVIASSESLDDSEPDLLSLVVANLHTVLSLRLDRALIQGLASDDSGNGIVGLDTITGADDAGAQVIDAQGVLDNYDLLLRAVGLLRGNGARGPLAAICHPWTATWLSLVKESESATNVYVGAPPEVPPLRTSRQVPHDNALGTSTVYIYDTSQVAVVNRIAVPAGVVEVDRPEEFSSDAVVVRGKLRVGLAVPLASQCVVKITNVPALDPADESSS